MSESSAIYRTLSLDERQEFRLPKLLKEHLSRAAAQSGQSVTEYITAALAERVTLDLAESIRWDLSLDEQATLLKVLAGTPEPSERSRAVAERADKLFGKLEG